MKATDLQLLANLYQRMAPEYDGYARLYPLIGFRQMRYRRLAIEALHLKPGSTVVDIGCGTGLNFDRLQEAIGPSGRIIGVDLSDAMLEQARTKVLQRGWQNIELICGDAAQFRFPPTVGGIISTFALTLVPEYDTVIRRGSQALGIGDRWCVLDFRMPRNWLLHLAPVLARLLVVPFGGTLEMSQRHPWESIRKHLDLVLYRELYFGCVYVAVGQRYGGEARARNIEMCATVDRRLKRCTAFDKIAGALDLTHQPGQRKLKYLGRGIDPPRSWKGRNVIPHTCLRVRWLGSSLKQRRKP